METLLAQRADRIVGSVIDASTSLLEQQQHDVVRLAMGSPASDGIPTDAFAEILRRESAQPSAFDYAATEGDPLLRAAIGDLLAAQGESTPPERLLVTTGGMQGLDLVFKLFLDPGDTVAVEAPTYTNGTATALSYQANIVEIPCDDEGMQVDALAELDATPPKVIYTVPTFQNPSGATMPLRRRERLLELAARWGALVLEDDPYSMLRFRGDGVPALQQLAGGEAHVIRVQTFSKIIAPGLRVGWLTAPPDVVDLMVRARQSMDTCTNTLQQRLVARFLGDGRLDQHLTDMRRAYGQRKDAIQRALQESFGDLGARWTDPDGGFFLWLTLPEGFDGEAAFATAVEEGVAYVPGNAFTVDDRFPNAVRLAFSAESPDRLALGVKRLRRAVDRQLAGTVTG